ncbi:hypothetical protein [Algicella marina]|uniref:Uncharacterized protein n=1 Tax=Algicella marina TaxID=2683284 RepID=A0A6P1SX44_9RHOB|nr:hypothetical protein [Algicella marina]QHQ35244.1 hypothetical protein GO499_08545 [Algicella marina]
MPHDHPVDHDHHHDHHHHGHNQPGVDHHSHMQDVDEAAEIQVLTDQFIDGFQQAKDKMSYLRLAGVPLEVPDVAHGTAMKLVDVRLTTEWQVGTASPSFGSRELSYLPYPGEMVTERTNLEFVYVSLRSKQLSDLRHFLAQKLRDEAANSG